MDTHLFEEKVNDFIKSIPTCTHITHEEFRKSVIPAIITQQSYSNGSEFECFVEAVCQQVYKENMDYFNIKCIFAHNLYACLFSLGDEIHDFKISIEEIE